MKITVIAREVGPLYCPTNRGNLNDYFHIHLIHHSSIFAAAGIFGKDMAKCGADHCPYSGIRLDFTSPARRSSHIYKIKSG
jgi:hypothetical protein